jgi:ABC-type transporter Mla subunit MlaD
MVGAVTTLIVIVAVFLAYNANTGLPFVPVYRVSAEVPNGSRLVRNNEVRIGGHRVGVVESIEPTRVSPRRAGRPDAAPRDGTCCIAARLDLKLDQSASPIPRDSIFRVRYRSSFGLKYLEITRGTGPPAPEGYVFNGLDDGGDCPLPENLRSFASTEPASAKNGCFQKQVEFDAINDTFDTRTRTNTRANLVGFGDAFAGRGGSLNDAIANLRPLFANLKPVAETLSDPSTELRRFFQALARTAAIVAPVAVQQADLFTQAAIAFDSISSDPVALRGTISEGAALLEEAPAELRRQRPFLAELTELSRRLRPGLRELRIAIPTLTDAVQVGTPVLNRTPPVNRDLRDVMAALKALVQDPHTRLSLERLEEAFDQARPLAEYVGPTQTVCNYWNYDWTLLSEHLSERDQIGFTQRVQLVNMPNNHFVQAPLDAYSGRQANGIAGPLGDPQHGTPPNQFAPHTLPILHGNPYAPTGQPGYGQYPDCQPGQTGYPLGDFRVPGQSSSNPAFGLSDIPGSRGITDAFWNASGERVLKNTTIASHLPRPLP